MKQANQKVWINNAGDALVPDGDPDAAVLFAPEGGLLLDTDLEPYSNAGSFMSDVTLQEVGISNRSGDPVVLTTVAPPQPQQQQHT